MKTHFPPEWRAQAKWKRRFYAKYMKWLEVLGYVTVAGVITAFVMAFNVRVDDVITADKVPLRALSREVKAPGPSLVIRQIAPAFAEVREGDPLLEVVVGDAAIRQYQVWDAARQMGAASPVSRPDTETLMAPKAGVFFPLLREKDGIQPPDTPLAEVRDYSRLVATASLSGQGVAKAVPGGRAILKGVTIEPHHGILLRGQTERGPLVSGQLGTESLRGQVGEALKGKTFSVRDDLPLQFEGLKDVQIDATLEVQPGGDGGVWSEPSARQEFSARVESGRHTATLQFAQLPPDLREAIQADISGSLRQSVRTLEGESLTITGVSGINTVIQAEAVPVEGSATGPAIPATAISRAFEAELSIEDPAPFLSAAVKAADRAGRKVTAKVELKTGDRPIATLLLRRS